MPGYQGCRNLLLVVLLLSASFSPSRSVAQSGMPPHGSFVARKIDTINLSNLNVHISIPLLQKQSRGYRIWYELSCDTNFYTSGNVYPQAFPEWPGPGCMIGWRTSKQASNVEYLVTPSLCDPYNEPYGPYSYAYGDFESIDNNNTRHIYNVNTIDSTECGGSSTTNSGYAIDGSGYYLTATGAATTVTDRNGVSSTSDIGDTPMDANGNMITESTSGNTSALTDTSGAQWTQTATPYSQGSPYTSTLTYRDSNGTTQNITATWEPYTIEATPDGVSLPYGPTQQDLLTSVVLPDGTSYQLAYEPSPGYPGDTTSRLASITLPSGGVISYQYTGGYNGFALDINAVGAVYGVAGLIRTTSDGTTTYSRTTTLTDNCIHDTGPCETVETTVQDPQGNQTVIDFASSGSSENLLETARRVYQGSAASGNLLLNTMHCYNGDTGNCTTSYIPSVTQDVSEIDETSTPSGAPASRTTTFYNTESLPTEVDEYDYGALSPSRVTTTSYATLGNNIQNRPYQVTVYDGAGSVAQKTTYGYDESALTPTSGLLDHIPVSGSRGNLTSTHEWINSSGSTFDSTYTYDDAGSLLSKADPNGRTTYGYDSSDTFLNNVTPPTPISGVSLPQSATPDPNTGLAINRTDISGETTYYQYDWASRVTRAQNPDGGVETFNYPSPSEVDETQTMSGSEAALRDTLMDGLGRISRIGVYNGQATNPWYLVDYCYGPNGRLGFRSSRYQGSGLSQAKVCSGAGDGFIYDALGRITQVLHAGGSSINYQYAGRAVEVTDEYGDARIIQRDALGRTTAVCEVSGNGSMPGSGSPVNCGLDVSGTGFLTTYAYNLANHTTTVTQGDQTRVFETDFLGRTTMTEEPETGTTRYYYGYIGTPGYGLQVTRTRPEANQTNPGVLTTTWTTYDSVGRIVGITYQNGDSSPTLSLDRYFTYDTAVGWGNLNLGASKGRLTFANTAGGNWAGAMFAYDAMGRVFETDQCIPGWCGNGALDKWIGYNYDQTGDLTGAGDAAGVTATYGYTPAGEVKSISSSLSDSTHPGALVSNVADGPGGPLSYRLGNGLNVILGYDAMGRLSSKWVCGGSTQYACAGGSTTYGFIIQRLGNLVTDVSDGIIGQHRDYGQDEFHRLSWMNSVDSGQQLYNWTYDRYGNRWQQNPQQGGQSSNLTFDTATNRINSAGYAYDAAGNMIQDPEHTYKYDAEGNLVEVDNGAMATYTYDALNRRVRIDEGVNSEGFVYNLAGQRVSVWDLGTEMQIQGEKYWGNQPIEIDGNAQATFPHEDWLGTIRAVTSYTGSVESQYTNLPFGDGSGATGSGSNPWQFASLDKDYYSGADSGADHAQFREYGDAEGRWMSPDPYVGSYDFTNPQSFNRYSYVLNDPLSLTDPPGLDWTYDCGPNCVGVVGTDDGDDGCLWCWNPVGVGTVGPQSPPQPPPSYRVTTRYINPNVGATNNQNIFTCAANFTDQYSIAGGLRALGIGNSGVGGFITNALGGNAFSGATNLISSFGSGAAGGHSVFYNMGQSLMAGPLQGIPGGSGPWGASASDLTSGAIVGGVFSAVTGADQTLQGLNGAASLASTGIDAAEFFSGVGFVRFGYDGLSYLAGLAHCAR